MADRNSTDFSAVEEKLDEVVKLLQDLFILDATRVGVKPADIRKLLGIGMSRVTDISRHIE